jgi:pyruvate kinase
MLKTKIICTIGPASDSLKMLREMIKSGMDVARLNFSHGDHAYHAENLVNIRQASEDVGRPAAVLVDLQGPKLRVGKMEGDGVPLTKGEEITLTTRPILGHVGEIPVQYADLPKLVEKGDRILLDDGMLELAVLGRSETDIVCKVITGGLLLSNKGLNLPRTHIGLPSITEKDKQDLAFALEHQADWLALSFVRNANDVVALQEQVRSQCAFGRPTPVIAKIEKPEAVHNIDSIIGAADGIMVARGDLGIEASPEEVPLMQKHIITKCNEAGVPVITATQMLESMIRSPRPTRAEASDVANAILDGTDAIMLSAETSIGQYPLEALRTMVRIARRAETELQKRLALALPSHPKTRNVAEAMSHATCEAAGELDAAAIVTPTVSGHTARMVSKYRPWAPIIAVTPSRIVQRQLGLYWGVRALLAQRTDSTDQMLAEAINAARDHGLVQPGDLVVATGGAAGSTPGTTNLMRVLTVERILAEGQGIGSIRVHGQVRLVKDVLPDPATIAASDILVLQHTTREHVHLAQKAGGLVVVERGMDSHAAQLAMELGITAIVGAEKAMSILSDGQAVTLDPTRGRVYEGEVKA